VCASLEKQVGRNFVVDSNCAIQRDVRRCLIIRWRFQRTVFCFGILQLFQTSIIVNHVWLIFRSHESKNLNYESICFCSTTQYLQN